MRATIISIFSLATAVSAAGNAIVINNSLEPLYLWTEGDVISEQHTVAPSSTWTEAFHRGEDVPGVAIKIAKVQDGLFNEEPTLVFGYTLDPDRVWYSIDAVNGEPFEGQKLMLSSVGGTGDVEWPSGKDIGEEIRDNEPDADVVLTIDPQSGSGSGSKPAPSSPAPSSSAAPAPSAPTPTSAPPPADSSAPSEGEGEDGSEENEGDEEGGDENEEEGDEGEEGEDEE
ncbi:unnamed protein product [Periconia digitata]|uniref:Uncharacterized protein n=1 Tax=Periconia digitata TaxID=1303443 RepID=A0A9W4XMR4_9PLEO|nr:unnamed protein product [Periconia digitata]